MSPLRLTISPDAEREIEIYYRHSSEEVQVLLVWGAQFEDEPEL